ncbi:MAG: DNA primase [bacterium]
MATRVSEQTIREIAERVSILDVISPLVSLTKAGKYYKGLCPFHPDKNPSLIVNPERNSFHCFGCSTGGDVYAFFMSFHHVSFPQALEELARRAGIALERQRPGVSTAEEEAHREALELNRLVCQFFQDNLKKSPGGDAARKYLQERGIEPAMISLYQLGLASKEWDSLYRYLQRHRNLIPTACNLGLLTQRKGANGFFDRFRNRLMFPIMDGTGKVLGFGGRSLDEQGPKYMNSPESFLYRKGSLLYGLFHSQRSIREQDSVILVEGYFDLLSLHQHGIPHSVAVLGTSLTSQQIDLLRKYSRRFILVFDGDEAGRRASFRNLPDFLEKGIPARVVYLPEGEDPDSLLRKRGGQAFQSFLDGAAPLLDVLVREKMRQARATDRIEVKAALLRDLIPLLQKIPDRLEQNLRIRAVAEEAGVPEPLLRAELSKPKGGRQAQIPPVAAPSGSACDWPAEERLICQILIQFPHMMTRFKETAVLERFRSAAAQKVIRDLEGQCRREGGLNLSEILALQQDPDVSRLLASLSCRQDLEDREAAGALEDAVRCIQRRDLRDRLSAINSRIREAEQREQGELQNQLFLEKQRLIEEEKGLLS